VCAQRERLKTTLVVRRGVLIAQASGRVAPRGQGVCGCFDALAVGCGLGEVVRERLDAPVEVAKRFDCFVELAMKAHPPRRSQLHVDRLAHQRMRKDMLSMLGLDQQSRRDGLVESVQYARVLPQRAFE
jgi:hypothetical protein